MQDAITNEYNNADCIIMAAAVCDYRVKNYSSNKIKKENNETLTLELEKNPDILAQLCKTKSEQSGKSPIIVGFCAESENLLNNAKIKIEKKGCDFLVANDISRSDIGFNTDENEVYILDKSGKTTHIEKSSKYDIAYKIFEHINSVI